MLHADTFYCTMLLLTHTTDQIHSVAAAMLSQIFTTSHKCWKEEEEED